MNAYGILLKKLIRFSNIKLSNLAEIVGYDTSYISKWCNKDKLPASKASTNVNKSMAEVFAREIYLQEDADLFAREFNQPKTISESDLSTQIFILLKDAYKTSYEHTIDDTKIITNSPVRVLVWQPEIVDFFKHELPDTIKKMKQDRHILCSLDISRMISSMSFETAKPSSSEYLTDIKIGIHSDVSKYPHSMMKKLYYMMNFYDHVRFNFYDQSNLSHQNLIIIKDCMAVQCSLDKNYYVSAATIITDVSIVNTLYDKLSPDFSMNKLLIHASDSDELLVNGYRTDFYTHHQFQILLTKGFEFLLPPSIIPKLIQSAKEQGFPDRVGQVIANLGITWEEIFEKGAVDFYLIKSRLLQYISDGHILFTDVAYQMSVDERREHVEYILKTLQSNRNIRFIVIDDDQIPNASNLLHTSLYNNHKKMFLKNMNYSNSSEPRFYTIHNDKLIEHVSEYLNSIITSHKCKVYSCDDALRFYEKYGTLIQRMLSLGETL